MKISKYIVTVLFSALAFCDFAQNANWINDQGNNYYSQSNAVATDASGSAYTAGTYLGGAAIIGSYTLSNPAQVHGFISKTSASGITRWAKAISSTESGDASSISADVAANIYAAGIFSLNATCGSFSLTSSGLAAFICKLDSSGNFLWAKKYADNGYCLILNMINDATGNLYITGSLSGTCVIGSYTLTSPGNLDAFVAKLDVNGNVLWAQKMGGAMTDNAKGITIDNAGDVYVTGDFETSAVFGSFSLTALGNSDAFVAKLSPSGTFLSATKFGGSGADYGTAITANSGGKIYISGNFTPPVSFGVTTFTSGYSYLCDISSSISVNWAHKYEAIPSGQVSINSLATDVTGNVYSTGYFKGTVAFGPAGTATLTSPFSGAGQAAFFNKLDGMGNFVWVNEFKSIEATGLGIACQSDKLFATGFFRGSSSIDSYTLNSPTNSIGNGFLVKLNAYDVGIKENMMELNVFMYPNPATNHLVIESGDLGKELFYSLFDVAGKELIHKKRMNAARETIDVSAYSKGIYFLQIASNRQNITRKIIIN